MAKGSRGRRRLASRRYRPTPYQLPSRHREILAKDMHQKECSKALEKKDWENATCSVCMEYPHHAVLLLCSSHDKGCRPYMCGTSYRYSNCLDQYKKAYTKVMSPHHGQPWNLGIGSDSGWPSKKCEVMELACPLCRGQVKGWTVVEPAREYLNAKKRSCTQDNCSFVGTYKELRKHVRAEHPSARPREVDPISEEKWTRLEHERERDDVISTIRSSMPGAMVLGDYVIEGNYHGFDTDDEEGDAADGDTGYDIGFNDDFLNVLFLLQAFGPAGNRRLRRPGRGHHHSLDESGGVGIHHATVAGGEAASGRDVYDDDDDDDTTPVGRRQGRVLLGRSVRRRRHREFIRRILFSKKWWELLHLEQLFVSKLKNASSDTICSNLHHLFVGRKICWQENRNSAREAQTALVADMYSRRAGVVVWNLSLSYPLNDWEVGDFVSLLSLLESVKVVESVRDHWVWASNTSGRFSMKAYVQEANPGELMDATNKKHLIQHASDENVNLLYYGYGMM
ncbi:hypothetical protein HHK36_007838 [Tetracentron sinense]|uniref:Uncharacterized protein n=1 Tax=Tetracentron sinense TaxID=13715 RepID=A0A834ZFC3_TETSI|nr:hypothetical protein HHK36_007838 [Tetracentron sinense]